MTKQEFKEFCIENNLRYKKDACGATFVATKEQALKVASFLGCAKNAVSQETRDKMSRLLKERLYSD